MTDIIIVDDEERIRLGLTKIVSKASEEYRIAGSFSNPLEVIRYLEENGPLDILITDINMPQMDGIQLVEYVKTKLPHVTCIIVSGYNDFEYARNALRFGVADYLLKPIDKQELYSLLFRISEKRKEQERETSLVEDNMLHLTLHPDGVKGELQKQEIFTYLKTYIIPKGTTHYLFLVVKSKNHVIDLDTVLQKKCCKVKGIRLERSKQVIVMFFQDSQQGSQIEQSRSDSARIVKFLEEHLESMPQEPIAIGISQEMKEITRWSEGYNQANLACEYAMYEPLNQSIIEYKDVTCHFDRKKVIQTLIEKELPSAFEVLDEKKLKEHLQKIFEEIYRRRFPLLEILQICEHILHAASKEIPEFVQVLKEIDGGHWEEHIQQQFLKLREIQQYFIHLLLSILAIIKEKRNKQGNRTIELVKQIIEEEYKDEMDLSRLAERVFLTPSYLSKYFKTETGETITDYLIKIRLNKAKELLKNRLDYKTYEVGHKVGYHDPAYFNKLFKRMVGMTPKEYRNRTR